MGTRCHVPQIPSLGEACPVKLLQGWLKTRTRMWPECHAGPVFCVTTAKVARHISADTTRKSLAAFFRSSSTGSHSLRKGGAHWWKVHGKVPEQLIQAQGGWSSPDVMRAVYARFDEQERLACFAGAAANVPLSGAVRPPAGATPEVSSAAARVAPDTPMPHWRRLAGTL